MAKTAVLTLTEFLLARIAEDEAAAREALDDWSLVDFNCVENADHGTRNKPARVLAGCEAKRRIVNNAWADQERIEGEWGTGKSREEMSALNDNPPIVQILAALYEDHPDYRDEWRP